MEIHRLITEEKVSGLKTENYFTTPEKAYKAIGLTLVDEGLGLALGETKTHRFSLWINWTALDGPVTLPRG